MLRDDYIPSFSLIRQNKIIENELVDCYTQLITKSLFILGENVDALERKISEYCQANHSIGVASGSDALFLSLLAFDIQPGDEVITSPFTFFATAGAIMRVGAIPVFVDIDPNTWNMNINQIEEKISPRTKVILPVHIFGCPVDMDRIMQIAEYNSLIVIEDAAQALGAMYKRQKVGSLGDAGCLSFFPTKNLGAFGDAGMIITNCTIKAAIIRQLHVHGAKHKYIHDFLGYNSRLDELQAAVLNVKLKYLAQWIQRRRQIAQMYTTMLSDLYHKGLIIHLPFEPEYGHHVYHQYTIQIQKREKLQIYLENQGIGSSVYYPVPLHLQKALSYLKCEAGDYPIAEAACNEVLSLPMFPELNNSEVVKVVEAIYDFTRRECF